MSGRIAIVGMACRYPDAADPGQLWDNVLAGRRAFRRIPDERMRLADYWSPDPAAPDRFYSAKAALIEGFDFDRVEFRVAGSTFRVTDMSHWLALDTAARALADAGFPGGDGLPKQSTAVVVGNTLTGEFARANLMRLRWPYVRRVVGTALRERGWDETAVSEFLCDLEPRYKAPFPPVDEDTLAGGLSNTIAGRICNQFDLNGGGFTVDAACSSSLLAVAEACAALRAGQADAAIAGGVDLSIDPFEVIGFAKTGALARTDMRVYDRNSNGFWPGEGCGMLVLVRQEDAEARGLRCYASIAGWGFASDGQGGLTRPEPEGHLLALRRAYEVAGFDISTVGYLEGHGTGTAVGDETELRVLAQARRESGPDAPAAAISTVKGNIGHTKAAAGVAGLIKAALAVHHQVIPPATSHHDAHPELAGPSPALRVPLAAELWPAGQPVRAGVSAMGFGGINTHVVLEGCDETRRISLDARTAELVMSRQDCEVLLLDAGSRAELRERVTKLTEQCPRLAFAELADLAAELEQALSGGPVRAAVVAASPEEAADRLATVGTMLDGGVENAVDVAAGVYVGSGTRLPRIGYLFPGQGSGRRAGGGAIARRFSCAGELYRTLDPRVASDLADTAAAQPRIVAESVAGLRVLSQLGIEASAAVGHSLGELTSLHWAGGMDEPTLLRLAAARGRVMASASEGGGAMASIAAGPELVRPLLNGWPVVIAGYNSPHQTVISGPADAVDSVCKLAGDQGMMTARIAVSHAFHSPAVAPAATQLATHLARERFARLERRVVSTVTGDELPAGTDLADLLVRQVLEPVHFAEALHRMAAATDLLIEVGPGRVLTALAADVAPGVPVVAMNADSLSLSGTLHAVAAAFVLGAPVRHAELFAGRLNRPMPPELSFFVSPCELAPADVVADTADPAAVSQHPPDDVAPSEPASGDQARDSLELLRRVTAQRAELPLEAVRADVRLLDELHVSSITVGQIVNQAARELGVPAPMSGASLATATLSDLARMLDEVASTALPGEAEDARPEGAGTWVRAFSIELAAKAAGARIVPPSRGQWEVFCPAGHPLAQPLRRALQDAALGPGVLLCLPGGSQEPYISLMLDAAHAAVAAAPSCRFVVVQDGAGAAGLAKTLHLEVPEVATTIVSLPQPPGMSAAAVTAAVARVVGDVEATAGFSEVRYDPAGTRRVPVLRPVRVLRPVADAIDPSEPVLGPEDVLLVTGGGKGICAECALGLARQTGVAVGLLGRSDPAADAELAANLDRFRAAGVSHCYVRADVTSHGEVSAAVRQVTAELGPVTAVLHGAGRNQPVPLSELDEAAFRQTVGPKLTGLEAVLAAVDPASVRLLVSFGSIIGRAGLHGQADYATANDWLTERTRDFQAAHPHCRCLALEWSVWAGAGMGERLGVVESLTREGITAIPVDAGVTALCQLIGRADLPTALVVMSRAGDLPTITLEPAELPLARFLDRPRVYYPGIELVVDADLSAATDPYLRDHLLDGEMLFPAVFGIEAMTQAAAALAGSAAGPWLERVEFLRPLVVPADGSLTIRVAALNHGEAVDVVIRSSDTGFQADHFRATVRWRRAEPPDDHVRPAAATLPPVLMDPGRELYNGGIFFQGQRFQRVVGYRAIAATSCLAEISARPADQADSWFGPFLPAALMLGDPGARDAFMHAIQCCVPNATLLPAGVDRIYPVAPVDGVSRLVLAAVERHHEGDSYCYDLDVRDDSGRLVERWEGLRLRAVRKQDGSGPWVPALLGPYLERQLASLLPGVPRCVIEPGGSDPAGQSAPAGPTARRRQSRVAVSRVLGHGAAVRFRRDGRLEVTDSMRVSVSHAAGVTLAAGYAGQIGCAIEVVGDPVAADAEPVLEADGLKLANLIGTEHGEDVAVSATRIRAAAESLRNAGRPAEVAGALAECGPDGWVVLTTSDAMIATCSTYLRNEPAQVVLAICVEGGA